jgi:glycosyltransferase involved in cell wall biosynthesis
MSLRVVAVIPAYNAGASLPRVVRGVRQYLDEVIVVDDGSTDDAAAEAAAAGARVVRLEVNRGKGFALRRGIAEALALDPDGVLLLDADGQHDPHDIPHLLRAWQRAEGDLVIGARLADREAIPGARYWANRIGTRALTWMTGAELEDTQSGYRLVSADLLRRLPLTADGYAIESEMLIKAAHRGARICHVPVRTIYDDNPSYYRPVLDTARICLWCIYYKTWDQV